MNLMNRRLLSISTAVLVGCGVLQVTSAPSVAAPTAAPLAFSGVVAGVDELSPTSVKIEIEPDQQQLQAHPGAVSVEQSEVPSTMIETSGNSYAVRVDPTLIPAEDMSDTGIVTFTVFVQDPDAPQYNQTTVSVRAVLTESGDYAWTDPLSATVEADTPDAITEKAVTKGTSQIRPVRVRMAAPRYDGRLCNAEGCAPTRHATSTDRRMVSSVDDETETGLIDAPEYTEGPALGDDCDDFEGAGTVYTNTYRKVSTTIGTAYPVGDDTAWMTHTVGSSSEFTGTYGIGFSDIYPFASGSFTGSESKTTEQSSGFDWDPKGYSRSFRVGISYRKVEGWYDRCPGDPGVSGQPYWVKWEPHHYNGSFGENTDGVSRPDWTNCVDIGSTGTWWRSRSDGNSYSYSAGVKFAKVIGIDLSTKRAYNGEAKTAYQLKVVHRRMCGNNADPGIAGKVMERL